VYFCCSVMWQLRCSQARLPGNKRLLRVVQDCRRLVAAHLYTRSKNRSRLGMAPHSTSPLSSSSGLALPLGARHPESLDSFAPLQQARLVGWVCDTAGS
jgi:hypothetical protein